MNIGKEKWIRWVRGLATACRYLGVIVLTFTLTTVMAVNEEFQKMVEKPLHAVAGPNWVDDIRIVSDSTRAAHRYLEAEEVASFLVEGNEEDEGYRAWLEELAQVAAYAGELEEAVIRGSEIKPISKESPESYSPFDSFYGTDVGSTPPQSDGEAADKNRSDLNNEALRAWNAGMKDRGYAVLSIPSGAALHPYKGIVNAFLWAGGGLLAVGMAPVIASFWGGRRGKGA